MTLRVSTHFLFILLYLFLFFFNDSAPTHIYTLSLHDALPISSLQQGSAGHVPALRGGRHAHLRGGDHRESLLRGDQRDRKSTRLNSSHTVISYAVFCLKKKKKKKKKQK